MWFGRKLVVHFCVMCTDLLDAFIVCLMGHTAVQTSVAQGFLAAEATLFHVLMPIETSRNVNLYNASPMRFSTFVHDLMTLQTPEGQTRTAELRFLPKLFGTDAEQSPRVRVLWIRRCWQGLRFRFPWFWCSCVRSRMSRQPRDGWAELLFHPRCERATSMTAGYDCVNNATVATRATTQGPIS